MQVALNQPMKILSVAYPFAPVRGDTAGGAEQVLGMLDCALTRTGHASYTVACEGSQVGGELFATPLPPGRIDDTAREETWACVRSVLGSAIDRVRPDLIHMHGLDFLEYLPEANGIPVIATLHLPPSWYAPDTFKIARPRTWIHCVSRSQEEACPRADNLLPFIPNGVREDLPVRGGARGNFALSLGRMCPEKGFHLALTAAAQARVPMLLAGQVYGYEEHQRYFREQILPQCNRTARFIGSVGLRKKRRLFSSARCLLIPSLAPETSSLVAMEAAMCGTPAIAFRSGALPEIIEENVTGFLVDDVAQMAEAIRRCDRFDAERCRDAALSRFSAVGTAAAYLRMYGRLIAAA